MDIKTYILGPLSTNTYLLTKDNDALIIDPASKPERLVEIIGNKNLLAILITHGHFDHIKAVDGLYEKYHCPVYLNKNDEEIARDKNSGADFGLVSYITCPIVALKEEQMNIGPFSFEVIFTPGHTKGSVLYKFENEIFTGDTLFKGSVGRTDLLGGNASELKESLRYFKCLNKDYCIFPGHEESSTLYKELNNNIYLK